MKAVFLFSNDTEEPLAILIVPSESKPDQIKASALEFGRKNNITWDFWDNAKIPFGIFELKTTTSLVEKGENN